LLSTPGRTLIFCTSTISEERQRRSAVPEVLQERSIFPDSLVGAIPGNVADARKPRRQALVEAEQIRIRRAALRKDRIQRSPRFLACWNCGFTTITS